MSPQPQVVNYLRRKRGLMDAINENAIPPEEERVIQVPLSAEEQAAKQAAQPQQPMVRDPELEQAAAAVQQQPPVQHWAPPPQVDDGEDLYDAQEADRKSRLAAAMELATRQLVGGITRTPVGQGIGAAPSQVPAAMEAAKSRRQQVVDALNRKRQGALDESTLALQKSQTERNLRPPPEKGPQIDYTDIKRGELERSNKALEETARHNKVVEGINASRAARAGVKPAAPSMESTQIPFAGGNFRPKTGAKIEKQIAKEASDKASLFNSAIRGIDNFSASLAEYAKNPSPENRDAVIAKANGVGGALNTAQGQGAMSEGEKKEMAAALGVDVLSSAGITAFTQSLLGNDKAKAASTITRRARAVRDSMIEMAKGNLESKNYDYVPGKDVPEAATPPTESIKVRRAKDGVVKSVSKASADALVAKGGYEIVP